MSIGGSKSSNKSTSTSNSSTQGEGYDYGTSLWSGQSPFLTDLYGRAQSASFGGDTNNLNYFYGNASNQNSASDQLLQTSNSVLSGMGGDYDMMYNRIGAADAGLGSAHTALDRSQMALQNFLNPGNADPLAAAYQRQMGQAFREEFMPELQGNAAIAGGLGGSRQQIGAALGSQRSMQAISDFNTGLYGQQMDRALAAAQGIGALAQGYQQNAAGYGAQAGAYGDVARLRAEQAQGFQNSAAGYQGASQNSMGMAQFGQQLPWYNLQQYAGLLGMPVTLDQGGFNWNNSQSTSTSKGSGGSSGFSFGLGK